ncbi:hypothetical protein HAX54_038704, partial [Datura stramonium]|nr:hypothetical protein [Datura stramonium]
MNQRPIGFPRNIELLKNVKIHPELTSGLYEPLFLVVGAGLENDSNVEQETMEGFNGSLYIPTTHGYGLWFCQFQFKFYSSG